MKTTQWVTLCATVVAFAAAPCLAEPVVSTEVLDGDPTVADATFTLGIRLSGNTEGPIGTYAYRLMLDSEVVTVEGVSDGGDGFQQPPSTDDSNPNAVAFSGVWAESTLENGVLCKFHMRTQELTGPYSIKLIPIPPTPLVAMKDFANLSHKVDDSATTNIGGSPDNMAMISTQLLNEGAIATGDTISIAVNIEGNAEEKIVGTYAFKLAYSPDSLEFVAVKDGELGAAPSSKVEGPIVKVSAFNAQSTLVNGRLLVADFKVTDADAERLGVMVQDLDATPLMAITFKPIPHAFRQDTAQLKAQGAEQ